MAKTAGTLISDAFRWLNVVAGEETASAAETVGALDTLNGMMAAFGPRGIAYAHTTLAATDTVNVADEQVRNVMILLANELAPEYEVTLGEGRQEQVTNALTQLQAAYFLQPVAGSEPLLRRRTFVTGNISRLD